MTANGPTAPNGNFWQSWAKVVLTSGVGAAIAMYLVYIGANDLPAIRVGQVRAESKLDLCISLATEIKKEQEMQIALRAWCVQISNTDEERRGCLSR